MDVRLDGSTGLHRSNLLRIFNVSHNLDSAIPIPMKSCDTETVGSMPYHVFFGRAVVLGFVGALVMITSLIVLGYDTIMYLKNLFLKILKKGFGMLSSLLFSKEK